MENVFVVWATLGSKSQDILASDGNPPLMEVQY